MARCDESPVLPVNVKSSRVIIIVVNLTHEVFYREQTVVGMEISVLFIDQSLLSIVRWGETSCWENDRSGSQNGRG